MILHTIYNFCVKVFWILADMAGPVAISIRGRANKIEWGKIGKRAVMGVPATVGAKYEIVNTISFYVHDPGFQQYVAWPIACAIGYGFVDWLAMKSTGTIKGSDATFQQAILESPYRVLPGGLVCTKCGRKYRDHDEDASAAPYKGIHPNKICDGSLVLTD